MSDCAKTCIVSVVCLCRWLIGAQRDSASSVVFRELWEFGAVDGYLEVNGLPDQVLGGFVHLCSDVHSGVAWIYR